ncbi:hypothetical protein Leryth_019753 [Lithospermum erythrorhizon]|nr:hypothetical protein Leryth_019753 [Lithospermum erythrorhizon]
MACVSMGTLSPPFSNGKSTSFDKTNGSRYQQCSLRSNGFVHCVNIGRREGKGSSVSSALPETAISIAVAATVVGAAARILSNRIESSKETEASLRTCEDCSGSGICSECKGEGFVLKKLTDASAEKARLMAKNAATRYTAGLPKKWSYCTKCTSTRSCSSCGGSGKLS